MDDIISTKSLEAAIVPRQGMSYGMAAFFLVAQMAGAGFLALPKALDDTGWLGVPILLLLCFAVGFAGTRLAHCWVILEERWEEYRKPARQPYMEIGYRSFGEVGRKVILVTVLVTQVGSTIVYIILISQFLQALIPGLSICVYSTIIAIAFIPFTWLGTPNDFWPASVLAVVATVIACLVIFVQLLVDNGTYVIPENPEYDHATVSTFSLGFGTILFSLGGASIFPTIQNDMRDRSMFSKSVSIGFFAIMLMYMPVAVTGYALLGNAVPGNILLYRENLNVALQIAIGLQIVNLLGTFLIAYNPACQIAEEMLDISPNFGVGRVMLRSGLLVFELIVALGIPDFGLIMNLIGGSTITLCSFVAPPAMYLKLADDQSNPKWPKRTIPMWERIFLYEIIVIGTIGGICATLSAVYGIIDAGFGQSCFADYLKNDE